MNEKPLSPEYTLLDKNPKMKALRQKFMETRSKLVAAEGAARKKAVTSALDTIRGFLESTNAVWTEIGVVGAKEQDIWLNDLRILGLPAFEKKQDLLFLSSYYTFWESFNALFDSVIAAMDETLPKVHDTLATPKIDAVVRLDQPGSSSVASLETLFAQIQEFRKKQAAASWPPAKTLALAAPIIKNFCQDGDYVDGLIRMTFMQQQLLGALKAKDVRAALAKEPSLAKVVGASPGTTEGDVTRRVLELLYQSQGVFLFLNAFQSQAVTGALQVLR